VKEIELSQAQTIRIFKVTTLELVFVDEIIVKLQIYTLFFERANWPFV
jgi:hypothetical protein